MTPYRDPSRLTLIDDDPRMLRVLTLLLETEGFDIRGFTAPEIALDHLRDHGADAVITDLGMPGIDGVELCRRVRDAKGDDAPPFVLHTGSAYAVGPSERSLFAAVIEKPCRLDQMLSTIRTACSTRPR